MAINNDIIFALVDEVPKGQVASYGMIASLLPGVGPRQVGSALGKLGERSKTPWHRILQSSGAIADRVGAERQRRRLKREGITFRKNAAVDIAAHRWGGPSPIWIAANERDPLEIMEIVAGWGR